MRNIVWREEAQLNACLQTCDLLAVLLGAAGGTVAGCALFSVRTYKTRFSAVCDGSGFRRLENGCREKGFYVHNAECSNEYKEEKQHVYGNHQGSCGVAHKGRYKSFREHSEYG